MCAGSDGILNIRAGALPGHAVGSRVEVHDVFVDAEFLVKRKRRVVAVVGPPLYHAFSKPFAKLTSRCCF